MEIYNDYITIMYGSTVNSIKTLTPRSDPIQYSLNKCTGKVDFTTTPPSEKDKVWLITKTSTRLNIDCNGVTVLDYAYSDSR